MSTVFEPAAARAHARTRRTTLVWDAPTRVFHWLLALSFAGAYLTAERHGLHALHVTLGYTTAGLVAFRIVWGVLGTRHARFASFVRGPRAAAAYLRAFFSARPQCHAGHNPAGALAIVALLGLAAALTASGWTMETVSAPHWLEETHEAIAATMLAVVLLHIVAVVATSLRHRENLVGAMISGRKPVPAQQGIRSAWRSVAALMVVAILGFWWTQWKAGALPDIGAIAALAEGHAHEGDD